MRAIHAVPIEDFPDGWTEQVWVGRTPASIGERPPVDDPVLVHGDACAPNTLISDTGEWTGNVDLAVGDRWADLAIASMSIGWNFGEGHQGELFDAYGIDADQERIAYYGRSGTWSPDPSESDVPIDKPAGLVHMKPTDQCHRVRLFGACDTTMTVPYGVPMTDGGPILPPPVTGPPTMPPAGAAPFPSQGIPPPPGTPPPPSGGDGGDTSGPGESWWMEWWWVFALAAVAAIAIAVVLVLDKSGNDDDAGPAPTQATTTTIDEGGSSTPPPPTDPTAPSTTDTDTTTSEVPKSTEAPTTTASSSSQEIAGAPGGQKGDRKSPVPVGSIADIGDGWRLQVLDVADDATDEVLAENQFNEPPPNGSRFTLVTVAMGYFGNDDPQAALFTDISAVASGNAELDTDCGVTPNELDIFVDMFAGAVQTGTLCFVTTPADSDELQLYATAGFSGDAVFLDASATPTSVEPLAAMTGAQTGAKATKARQSAASLGTTVELGEGWSLAVTSPATDFTDTVLGDNQFNDPPPDGYRFVSVGIELAYDGEGTGDAYVANVSAVGDSNIGLDSRCGDFDDEIDLFSDVFAGGTTAGLLCFVAPESDVGTIDLYATAEYNDNYRYLATD